jgi:hypothetical protein
VIFPERALPVDHDEGEIEYLAPSDVLRRYEALLRRRV